MALGEDKDEVLEHGVGMVLDDMSVDELKLRIGLLESEIMRLDTEIKNKSASRAAAENAFK